MEIPRYQVHDFRFSARTNKNPYDANVFATFWGPDGSELQLPGFYDGDETWIIRFSPPQLGAWRFQTTSDVAGLDHLEREEIVCVPNENPNIHGGLQIDEAHPHHFCYADGTRCFPLGDECDWLFALELPQARRYLDRLQRFGFNQVLMQVYAHEANWSQGQPHQVAPSPLYPWQGDNDHPDHSHLNPAFWQHLDRIMDHMHQHGILAHLMIEVHNKNVNWPSAGSGNDERYWRYVLARYQAYSHVIWSLSKEAWKIDDDRYWQTRLNWVRQWDAYKHLVTAHDVELPEADFLADQHHQNYHAHILHQRAKRNWPVMNVEYGYEPGPIPTYPRITLPDEMRCRTWEIVIAGGYPVFYYADTAWDVIELDTLPTGYQAFHVLRQVVDEIPYWEMESHDDLVDRGYCLAQPGKAYLIYLPEGGRVHLDASDVSRGTRLNARWINPRDGQRLAAGPIRSGVNSYMTPNGFGVGDSVLLVR